MEICKKSRLRRLLSIGLLLLLFSTAGCGQNTGGGDSSSEGTAELTPILTLTPVPTLTPTPVPTETAEDISYSEEQTEEPTDDEGFWIEDTTVYAKANVNIRTKPSTEEGEIVDVLTAGEAVRRVGYTDGWSKVEINGEIYYISSEYLVTDLSETEAPSSEAVTPDPAASGNSNGITVCIDAGHQEYGISELEPNGPGSADMKAKLTSGTAGVVTGKAEYQLNLEVSLLLRDELQSRGYQVVMIRETNSCTLSNAERAVYANESGADLFVRIHANSSTDPDMNGVLTMAPSAENPYVAYLSADSIRLSQAIVDGISSATGARNIGVLTTDTMTGINWCTIPVSIVEMGYMSNPAEDQKMSDPAYQAQIVQGIANGIDVYMGR